MSRTGTSKSPRRKSPPATAGITALQDNASTAAQLLRALSNEHRLMLLCLLFEGEKSVSELNGSLALSQSALSQHLAVLRDQSLVRTRRAGQSIYYGLASEPARRVVETLHGIYCPERC